MAPAVSIIVPCYNCRDTICEAVESVLAQTIADWECILVSDDGTSYLDYLISQGIADPRIIEHPERSHGSGTVAPRNRGFQMARGQFIADLDADDIWKPRRLERLLPLAERHGCVQDVLECFNGLGVIGYSGATDGPDRLLDVAAVVAFDFPFHLVVRRDRAGAEWSAHDSWVPDVIRAMLLAAETPVCWLSEPLLRYRVSAASMSQSLAGSRRIGQAYGDILARLDHGDGFGLGDADRAAAHAGVSRKQSLNRRYMAAVEGEPEPMPFIEWIMANGHSGVAVAAPG